MGYKIYVSLPMGGQENTVKARFEKAVNEIKQIWGDTAEIVSPCNIGQFDDNGLVGPRDHDWAWYMGRDIEVLLRCDAIYMTKGYLLSPGCRCELAVARERDLHVYYADDAAEYLNTKAVCADAE